MDRTENPGTAYSHPNIELYPIDIRHVCLAWNVQDHFLKRPAILAIQHRSKHEPYSKQSKQCRKQVSISFPSPSSVRQVADQEFLSPCGISLRFPFGINRERSSESYVVRMVDISGHLDRKQRDRNRERNWAVIGCREERQCVVLLGLNLSTSFHPRRCIQV